MKNAYNTSAYGSFAYVYDIFMEIVVKVVNNERLAACRHFTLCEKRTVSADTVCKDLFLIGVPLRI